MILVAIDGPSASGKGTICRYLATQYNLKHIDSGLLYRSIAWEIIQNSIDVHNVDHLEKFVESYTFSDSFNPKLRDEAVANITSIISVHPFIRDKVNAEIRNQWQCLLASYNGMIVDGRDIGTVVFPDADVKLFITASDQVRANRRMLEGDNNRHADIQSMVQQRDQRDQQRQTAPLKPADDAYIIDTSDLSAEQACVGAEKAIAAKL
jgi:cytidylate kinase